MKLDVNLLDVAYKVLLTFPMEKELGETHEANSQAVDKTKGENLTLHNKILVTQLDKEKTRYIGHDTPPELNNIEADTSFNIRENEITGEKSKTIDKMVDTVGDFDVAQRIDESKNASCKFQQENLETNTTLIESCHKEHKRDVMKSETQNEFVNILIQDYSSYKVNCRGDSDSNILEGNIDEKSKQNDLAKEMGDSRNPETLQMNQQEGEFPREDSNLEPIFDGTEDPGVEASNCRSTQSLKADQENQGVVEKALALKNFVRQKSLVAVSSLLHHLSEKWDEHSLFISGHETKDVSDSLKDSESREISEKTVNRYGLSPLNSIKMSFDVNVENKTEGQPQPIVMKGTVILYTILGCQECKEARQFLHMKKLRYVEINLDVYPSRKLELEKICGFVSIPKVFFNQMLIGGLSELKALNESGELDEKIGFLITEVPSLKPPIPPHSGEDDVSIIGAPDEMALIVRKMKGAIVVRDRFCRMRMFTNCFLGSEAVDFLSEDQYLERPVVSLIIILKHGSYACMLYPSMNRQS